MKSLTRRSPDDANMMKRSFFLSNKIHFAISWNLSDKIHLQHGICALPVVKMCTYLHVFIYAHRINALKFRWRMESNNFCSLKVQSHENKGGICYISFDRSISRAGDAHHKIFNFIKGTLRYLQKPFGICWRMLGVA